MTPRRRLSEQALLLLAILGIVTGTIVVAVAAAVVTPTVLVEPTPTPTPAPTPTPTPVPPTAIQVPHTLTITSGPVGTSNPVASGGTASLSVRAADSLNHVLGYNWTASCPGLGSNGSFNNAALQSATWTAPANTTGGPQKCTLQVTVSDDAGLTQSGSYSQGVQSLPHTLTIDGTQVAAKQTLVSVTGGTVAVDPAPGSDGRYASGTPVTLTADPAFGWDFRGWSGAGCLGTGRCVVRMDSDKSVKASFSRRILGSVGLEPVPLP